MMSRKSIFIIFMTIIIVITLLISIFINDIIFTSFDSISYSDYLKYTFGYINYPKTIILILVPLFIEFILIGLLIYILGVNFKYKLIKIILSVLLIITFIFIVPIFLLFYLPQHCSFNLCTYKEPQYPSIDEMRNEEYVSFIGIGDPQIFLSNEFKARNTNIYNLVSKINLLIKKINENDSSNIVFGNKRARELFNSSKNNIIGVINPGDMTQASYDGRFFSANELGLYEYLFPLSPDDGGLGNFYNYEILGNHDYQSKHGDWTRAVILYSKFENNSKSLLNRRNEKRKYIVNKDENGNYSCDFGNLHIIFINLHLSHDKLLTGVPESNIIFLKNDLKKYESHLKNESNSKMRWAIVTHGFNQVDLRNNEIGNIISNYKNKFVAVLSGHEHVLRTHARSINYKYSYLHVILPSPTINEKIDKNIIAYFVYNNKTSKLDIITITIGDDGKIYIV